MLRILQVPWASPDATGLRAAMYADLAERYPQETAAVERRGGFAVLDDEASAGLVEMVVAYDVDLSSGSRAALGCAALRAVATGEGERVEEVRKVFVLPSARRRGVATAMLEALERSAAGRGVHRVVLETGRRQPEALAGYLRLGYLEIAPWDGMVPDPTSVHLGKVLAAWPQVRRGVAGDGSIGAVEPEERPCRPSC